MGQMFNKKQSRINAIVVHQITLCKNHTIKKITTSCCQIGKKTLDDRTDIISGTVFNTTIRGRVCTYHGLHGNCSDCLDAVICFITFT